MRISHLLAKFYHELTLLFMGAAEQKYKKSVREENPNSYFDVTKFYMAFGRLGTAMTWCLKACESGVEGAEQTRQFLHQMLSSYHDVHSKFPGGLFTVYELLEMEDLLTKSSAYKERVGMEQHQAASHELNQQVTNDVRVEIDQYQAESHELNQQVISEACAEMDQHREELLAKAKAGDTDAQFELGQFYAKGLESSNLYIKPDYKEAVRWWREAGGRGDTRAQVILGYIYATAKEGVEQNEAEALQWWRKAAEAGHAGAQYELGLIHQDKAHAASEGYSKQTEADCWGLIYGSEATQEMSEAVKWMRRAGKQGYVDAQAWLGSVYASATDKSQNTLESAKWYRMAADQGMSKAQFAIADMYGKGKGVPQNWAEATRWYLAAAERGSENAQKTLGHMYASGDVLPKNYFEAAKWYRLAAERERRERYETYVGREYVYHPDYSAEGLAWLYEAAANGSRLAENVAERWCAEAKREQDEYAQEYRDQAPWLWVNKSPFYFWNNASDMIGSLRDLAEKGDIEAQLALGFIVNGVALESYVTGDYDDAKAEALKWFRMAADHGVALAQRILGDLHLEGKGGVKQNVAEAEYLYRMAAEQGDVEAQYQLGRIKHLEGEKKWRHQTEYDSDGRLITPNEYFEAAQWYLKAAEQGHVVAQHYLADLYAEGRGVNEDSQKAVKWRRKAAEQGYAEAQEALAETYRCGKGVPEDSTEAANWYHKAATYWYGRSAASRSLSWIYFDGDGVPQDGAEAMKWCRRYKLSLGRR